MFQLKWILSIAKDSSVCHFHFKCIKQCLIFLCKLKINHDDEIYKCEFILELGCGRVVTSKDNLRNKGEVWLKCTIKPKNQSQHLLRKITRNEDITPLLSNRIGDFLRGRSFILPSKIILIFFVGNTLSQKCVQISGYIQNATDKNLSNLGHLIK
jgi:hypothetical protein